MSGTIESSESGHVLVDGTAGLAAHLGLSRWTVSRVLNGHAGVKEATRQRVLTAMSELGFEPNRNARGLRGLPSGLVGVSLPDLEAMVLAQKSQALHRELKAAGYRGIFEMPEGNLEIELEVLRHFISIQVDAVVLIGSRLEVDSPVWEEARVRGVKLVAVDPVNRLEVPTVQLGRQRAMEKIVEHLHGHGHTRMAVLGVETDDLYGHKRKAGLKAGARRCGMDPEKDFVWLDQRGYSLQDYGYGVTLAEKLLALGEAAPRGLICLNDRIATGAMRRLQDAGMRIPEDFSVVGFDNLPESGWSNPALTTVDHNVGDLMRRAAKLLLQDTDAPVRREPVRAHVVMRASTGPCPS